MFSDAKVMVPFLDLANHSNSPNASFQVDPVENCVNLIALKDIESGAEVLIQYGEKGNEELMFQYGFAIEDNPFNKGKWFEMLFR